MNQLTYTKIEWTDFSWNPVIGCAKNPPCLYCYAHRMNKRFHFVPDYSHPQWIESNFQKSFPKKPSRIFVNSMSDIAFWKPEWMQCVLDKIDKYRKHNFLFLTKNPEIYFKYIFHPNCFLGTTIVIKQQLLNAIKIYNKLPFLTLKTFLSIEPIQEHIPLYYFNNNKNLFDWLIIGAETGNRKNKIIPKPEWIEELIDIDIPLFLKDNLIPIVGEKIVRENQKFPE